MTRRDLMWLFVLLAGGQTIGAEPSPPSAADIVAARTELLARLPPDPAAELSENQRRVQVARALSEVRRLLLVDVELCVTGPDGKALPDIEVRALHPRLDLSAGPVTTDDRGRATIRLPRGRWRVDVSGPGRRSGRVVFARASIRVDDPRPCDIALTELRPVRFRSRHGAPGRPDTVTLAWPDFSLHHRCEPGASSLEILTRGDDPIVLQVTRAPGSSPGYVARQTIGPGESTVVTDPPDRSTLEFRGASWRSLTPRLKSLDALPLELSFTATAHRRVVVSGLSRIAIGLDVTRKGVPYGFYARPLDLDGRERTFTGEPPFRVSVPVQQNNSRQYGRRRHGLAFRVLQTDPNGLILKGHRRRAAFRVDWEERLDEEVRASGAMTKWYVASTPVIEKKDIARLTYRLRIRGPGENRTVTVEPDTQREKITVGKLRTWCSPEIVPNARVWLTAAARVVRAFEEVRTTRRSRIDISLFSKMPPGVAGFGGFRGNVGFAHLPEGKTFGFCGRSAWYGLLVHELNHAHGSMKHGEGMLRVSRRAGHRHHATMDGMGRRPEGNRYRPLLEALTRGELPHDATIAGAPPALKRQAERGVLTPDRAYTGEDAVLTWLLRATGGLEADFERRRDTPTYAWWLVCRGFTDAEIEAAILSRTAGVSLAWLARLRGLRANDHRVASAVEALHAGSGKFVYSKPRRKIAKRWAVRKPGEEKDLDAVADAMRRELGSRTGRVSVLLAIAREHLARDAVALAKGALVDALFEARRGGPDRLEAALVEAAKIWASRPR